MWSVLELWRKPKGATDTKCETLKTRNNDQSAQENLTPTRQTCTLVPPSVIRQGLRRVWWLLFCTSSLSLAALFESAHVCSLADVMPCDRLRPRWAPRAPVPAPQAPPYPLPLAHHWAKTSHCCPSDARPRTQPLIKGTHWLTGDASLKSTWFWATETKEWG